MSDRVSSVLYFDNAYRTLALFDNATRSEVRSVFHQLKIRSKVAAGSDRADLLALLSPVTRSEDAVRDAFNALGNVSERLRQRLFWFSRSSSRDTYALDCIASGDYQGAVEAWGSAGDPGSRANLARLYHLLMIARDVLPAGEGVDRPAIPEKYTWVDAVRVWCEVIASDGFWEEFAALERASGFEPPAFGADIASLRSRVWESLLQPSLTLLARAVERKEYSSARDHIEDLRDAGVPAPRVAELEKESFVPVASAVDALIDEISTELHNDGADHATVRAAYRRYRNEVLPVLRDMLKHAGYNFEPSRQLCETCSELLQMLARKAADANETLLAMSLQNEANEVRNGGIEEDAFGRLSSSSGSFRAADAAPRRAGKLPGWVVLKIIVICVAVTARLASCGSRTSTSSYTYIPYSYHGPTSSMADIDTVSFADIDSIDGDAGSISEKLLALKYQESDLGQLRTSLRALMHDLDNEHEQVADLDSQAVAAGTKDTLNRGIARRAARVWLEKYRVDWREYDSLYTSYASAIATYNRDLSRLPDLEGRPGKMTMDDELRAAHATNRRRLAKWSRKYE